MIRSTRKLINNHPTTISVIGLNRIESNIANSFNTLKTSFWYDYIMLIKTIQGKFVTGDRSLSHIKKRDGV